MQVNPMDDTPNNVITTPMKRIRIVRAEIGEVEDMYRMYTWNKTVPVKGAFAHSGSCRFAQ